MQILVFVNSVIVVCIMLVVLSTKFVFFLRCFAVFSGASFGRAMYFRVSVASYHHQQVNLLHCCSRYWWAFLYVEGIN